MEDRRKAAPPERGEEQFPHPREAAVRAGVVVVEKDQGVGSPTLCLRAAGEKAKRTGQEGSIASCWVSGTRGYVLCV